MTDTPWTKGPWTLWDGDIVAQSDACNPIVTLYHDTSDADARLIAAAPDMADFLLVAREYIEHTANGEMDKGVSGIAKRDLARLDEILSAIRGNQ